MALSTMTYRTSFALDSATATRLRRLATLWQVSHAEVVRRAVAQAEVNALASRPDPVTRLRELQDSGQGLDPRKARSFLAEVGANRRQWGNAIHRRRGLQVDALIAAAATTRKARLATNNREDFARFVPHGLQIL